MEAWKLAKQDVGPYFSTNNRVDIEDQWIIEELAALLTKDQYTYEHSLRVGRLAKIMATYLDMDEKETRDLVSGCFLHDIGKILISKTLLNKSAALSKEEWLIIKRHPLFGVRRLQSQVHRERAIIEIVCFHHERWEGKGYPYGLSGTEIPKLARICAVLDAFDAMLSDRFYRSRISLEEAQAELVAHSGTQFDPYYVEVLLSLPAEAFEIYAPYK